MPIIGNNSSASRNGPRRADPLGATSVQSCLQEPMLAVGSPYDSILWGSRPPAVREEELCLDPAFYPVLWVGCGSWRQVYISRYCLCPRPMGIFAGQGPHTPSWLSKLPCCVTLSTSLCSPCASSPTIVLFCTLAVSPNS